MLYNYKTVARFAEAEITEKKSRFIACAGHIESEEEALAFINAIKKRHPNAGHNVYAYRIEAVERQSDDGEPSQTAGLPVLDVLRGAEILNGIIVVTRYFGGTLLGTGGLVRAYSKAAKEALSEAKIVERRLYFPVKITSDYGLSGKIQHELVNSGIFINDIIYTDKVSFCVCAEFSQKDNLIKKITDLTSATAGFSVENPVFGAVIDSKLIIYS